MSTRARILPRLLVRDGALEADAGVVDPRAERCVRPCCGRDVPVGPFVGDVQCHPGNRADLRRGPTGGGGVDVGDDDLVTGGDELDGDGAPDPAGGTGDDGRPRLRGVDPVGGVALALCGHGMRLGATRHRTYV